jgi:hypothetical protein
VARKMSAKRSTSAGAPRRARRRAEAPGLSAAVPTTLAAALASVQDVGRTVGSVAVATVRGSIRAAYQVGEELGAVARHAIKGTIEAAESLVTTGERSANRKPPTRVSGRRDRGGSKRPGRRSTS